MKGARGFLFASCFCAATGASVAEPSNVQFSAQVVKSTPDKKTHQSQIYVGDNQVDPAIDKNLLELATASILCNDGSLVEQQGQWLVQGDPTDGVIDLYVVVKDYRSAFDTLGRRLIAGVLPPTVVPSPSWP